MRYLNQSLLLAVMVLGPVTHFAQAQSTPIDRVEEDWELVVEQPDLVSAGPQITTTMSPFGDNGLGFLAFNLNYRESPFQAGGLQVQVWTGQGLSYSSKSRNTQSLSTPGETIAWTQRMSLFGGWVIFSIPNGASTTWGAFGQDSGLNILYPGAPSSLAGYSPETSIKNSGVGWQSNHVTSMTLKQVRYYSNNVLVRTDETVRPIDLMK